MSLTSDGLNLAQFVPLWREAMWHAVDPAERARLTLEFGRARNREKSPKTPLIVAWVESKEPPLTLIPLETLPSVAEDPAQHARVKEHLAELGATEAYVLLTLQAGVHEGQPSYVLVSYAQTVDGEESCWMQAFRYSRGELQEAPMMRAPDPKLTEVSRRLSDLLTLRH